MTPEKALDILEGKIPHRGVTKGTLDKKKMQPSIEDSSFKEMEIPYDNVGKRHDFIRILGIVLILGLLISVYLWRLAVVSKNTYKIGFNDGVASMSSNLSLAQNDISDKVLQLNQLQQELVNTKHDLSSVTQEKDQLAQRLKETQESIPGKISTLEQPLEEKIKTLTEESQKKISGLNNQLAFTQRNIDEKEKQLTQAREDLKSVTQQKDQLAQSLKGLQKSTPKQSNKINPERKIPVKGSSK